jgi:hypothetical protein
MSIQTILGEKTPDERLSLQWKTFGSPIAISIQVALDPEFTQQTRTFVLDKSIQTCVLDIGKGQWFYRLGAWIGVETEGIIDWSGIYGPVSLLQSNKSYIPLAPFPALITAIKPAYNGFDIHTDLYKPYYMIASLTTQEDFRASHLKTYYKRDWGNACVQLTNLDPVPTYSLQLQMLSGTNKASFPTKTNIDLLTEAYIVKNKKAGTPVKASSATEQTRYAADRALLIDAAGRNRPVFKSQTEYLQYKAARARTSSAQK